jgi:hypothetical protein
MLQTQRKLGKHFNYLIKTERLICLTDGAHQRDSAAQQRELCQTPQGFQDKIVPWTHLRALTTRTNIAPVQTWPVKYKIGRTGPTLMAVL